MKRTVLALALVALFSITGETSAQSRRNGGSKGGSSNSANGGSGGSRNGGSSSNGGNNGGNNGSSSRFGSNGGNGSSVFRERLGGSNDNHGKGNTGDNGSMGNGRFGEKIVDRIRNPRGNDGPPNNGFPRGPFKSGNDAQPADNGGRSPILDGRLPGGIGSRIRDRIDDARDGGKIGGGIGKVVGGNGGGNGGGNVGGGHPNGGNNPGGSAGRHGGISGSQQAARVLLGVDRALGAKNGWGLGTGNGGSGSKKNKAHDWGVCEKKHGHGFGFCYKPQHHVYHNPYCTKRYIAGCDYTVACRPLVEIVITDAGQTAVDAAIAAFRAGDYPAAERAVVVALREMPHNPDVRLLHSLILFAIADHANAAAACHTALTASAGWDWEALASFYSSTATYGVHLRLLENAVLRNPADPALRFLLGYHYLVLGYHGPAVTQLGEVVRVQPKDDVSVQLMVLAQSRLAASTVAVASVETAPNPMAPVQNGAVRDAPVQNGPVQNFPADAAPAQPAATPIDPDQVLPAEGPMTGSLGALASLDGGQTVPLDSPSAPAAAGLAGLVGTWTSNPTSGLVITFTVTGDGRFTWAVNRNGDVSTFDGTAAFDGSTLTLTRSSDGENLVGTATFTAANAFQFQTNAEGAPAITFAR